VRRQRSSRMGAACAGTAASATTGCAAGASTAHGVHVSNRQTGIPSTGGAPNFAKNGGANRCTMPGRKATSAPTRECPRPSRRNYRRQSRLENSPRPWGEFAALPFRIVLPRCVVPPPPTGGIFRIDGAVRLGTHNFLQCADLPCHNT
jgi:hypothetical protein